ncbi:hypothetical protein TNCV_938091 [Trichonephila clavipes]|nr:hypothetical protein TNCV_938091 [Trichonephila clavipes]
MTCHSRTPNTAVFRLSSVTWLPGLLEKVLSLERPSLPTIMHSGYISVDLSTILRKENPPSRSHIARPRSNFMSCCDKGFFLLNSFLANIDSIRQISQTNNAH